MKPLPLAIIVILVWTVLVIIDNWPQKRPAQRPRVPEPVVVTASNLPPAPQLQMREQPRYRPER